MTTQLPTTTIEILPAQATQSETLLERGIMIITLQYSIRDKQTGVLTRREVVLPTDMAVLPELMGVYEDTLKVAPLIRSKLDKSGDGDFVLIENGTRPVGCMSLKMGNLADRDFAWVNCMLAESEGVVLAFVPNASSAH